MKWNSPLALFAVLLTAGMVTVPTTAHGGIIISKTVIQTSGDPVYDFDFQLYLEPNSELRTDATHTSFLTVYDIHGISPPVFTSIIPSSNIPVNGAFTALPATLLGKNPNGPLPFTDNPTLYNITFKYFGDSLTNTGSTSLFLGDFIVETNIEVTNPPPSIIFTPINYGAQTTNPGTGGQQSNYGTTTPQFVPEPSFYAFLAGGAPVLALMFRARRNRRD